MNEGENKVATLWGWCMGGFKSDGYFSAIIPLNKIVGFAKGYNKIVINSKHELILNRSNPNLNSIISTDDIAHFEIDVQRIQWCVPVVHRVKVSDRERLLLLKHLEKVKPIRMAFRNWDLYEYPLIPKTTKHSWLVKTASQLEKPRYVIFR